MKTEDLLNEVKKCLDIESDYALAKKLNLPRGHISDYYKGIRHPNEYACLQIAQATNRSYEEVSALVRIEAEKNEAKREEWRRYYKRIGGIAASVAMMVFTSCILIVTPTPTNASIRADYTPTHFVLCQLLMLTAYLKRKLQLRQIRLKPRLCISVL